MAADYIVSIDVIESDNQTWHVVARYASHIGEVLASNLATRGFAETLAAEYREHYLGESEAA